jgi:hypothetical protein
MHDEGNNMHATKATTHTQQRQQYMHSKGDNVCMMKVITSMQRRPQHLQLQQQQDQYHVLGIVEVEIQVMYVYSIEI